MTDETQRVVITGGSGGLGQAVSRVFSQNGCHVDSPGSAELDVRDVRAVSDYFRDRTVNLLVCCAGITKDMPLIRLSEATWDETWDVNFKGALRCAEAVTSAMRVSGGGHIVFISSYSAIHPPAGQTAYAAAKASLLGLTAGLAARHGPSNIRVNAVLPGFMETRMARNVSETRKTEIFASHALGRLNTCSETADFIHFLHHGMPHTSGQVFQLDSRVGIP
jgi:3-oxoacyl-[acyl-carrier protein] reductase